MGKTKRGRASSCGLAHRMANARASRGQASAAANARGGNVRAGRLSLAGRGQASTEAIAVFGISMLVVLSFMAIGLNMLGDSARMQQENDAYRSAHDLVAAADEVFSQGEGASKSVLIKLPLSTVFNANSTYIGKPASFANNASVESKTVMIKYDAGEQSALAQEPLSGSFPSSHGMYRMKAVSQGNYVLIYPMLVELSQNSIYASMAQSENRVISVVVRRITSETVNVSLGEVRATSGVTYNVTTAPFAGQDNNMTITMKVVSGANASGFYSSNLLINATASPSNTSELILLPVGVDVQAG